MAALRSEFVILLLLFVLASVLSFALIVLLQPLFVRFALARPNSRSSHRIPTPQGGGIAIGLGMLIAVTVAVTFEPSLQLAKAQWWSVATAIVLVAAVGGVDDMRQLPVTPRLVAHVLTISIILLALPADFRIIPFVPLALERALLLLCGVYMVNIVNFMDGIDWMSVAEFVPVCTGVLVVAALGEVSPLATAVAAALSGALVGFAPFNRPVAKLFLGDVGSLPLGLLMFWLLLDLASHGYLAAAALLPLYYLMDATLTLMRRAHRGEPIYQAHRSHFYQRATDLGWSVPAIIAHVFTANLGLVVLAAWTVVCRGAANQVIAIALGLLLTAALLWRFSHERA